MGPSTAVSAPKDAGVHYPDGHIVRAMDPFDASGCTHPPVEKHCTDGWCTIPPGCFVMGSPPTEWDHPAKAENEGTVMLTHAFEVRQHETTHREWTSLGFDDVSGGRGENRVDCVDPSCPIGHLNWYEALAYADKVSEAQSLEPCYVLNNCTGTVGSGMNCESVTLTASSVYECSGYRLLTDAEWEYAARAGTRSAFYSGDITTYPQKDCYPDANLERIAWYCFNSTLGPNLTSHPVEQKEPNAWGLYDMLGNMDEWDNDKYTGRPVQSPAVDPGSDWSPVSDSRTARGGGYNGWSFLCRAASQQGISPGGRSAFGFRLARTLDAAASRDR